MSTKGTTVRKVRLDDDVWEPAKAKAAAEGTDRSTVLREALVAFLAAPPREWPQGGPGKPRARDGAEDDRLTPAEAKRLADQLGLRRGATL